METTLGADAHGAGAVVVVIALGIDTATPRTSIAIGDDGGILASLSMASRSRQDVAIPAIQQLLSWTGRAVGDLQGVAVGIGPGLFTGLRGGIQIAKSLGQVLGIPVVGVGTLDALALGVRHADGPVHAVIDGRRGEVFHAAFEVRDGVAVARSAPEVSRPEALAERLSAGTGALLVGDGAILYRDVFGPLPGVRIASAALAYPRASAVLELASAELVAGPGGRPEDVVPLYLRKTDAEIAWDERARGGRG